MGWNSAAYWVLVWPKREHIIYPVKNTLHQTLSIRTYIFIHNPYQSQFLSKPIFSLIKAAARSIAGIAPQPSFLWIATLRPRVVKIPEHLRRGVVAIDLPLVACKERPPTLVAHQSHQRRPKLRSKDRGTSKARASAHPPHGLSTFIKFFPKRAQVRLRHIRLVAHKKAQICAQARRSSSRRQSILRRFHRKIPCVAP